MKEIEEQKVLAKEQEIIKVKNALSTLSFRAQNELTKSINTENIDEFLIDLKDIVKIYKKTIKDGVSLLTLCDKQHYLPDGYEPKDLVSLQKENRGYVISRNLELRQMAEYNLALMAIAAQKENITLHVSSSYRSYEYQKTVYNRWVEIDGKEEADRESSRPGTSQHQLGTSVDFGSISEAYATTDECKWLMKHAEEYGWSLSFPSGYEEETGYKWECWHFRYIGKEACMFQKKYFNDIQQFMLQFLDSYMKIITEVSPLDSSL